MFCDTIMSYICGMENFMYGVLMFTIFIGVLAFVIQRMAKSALKRMEHKEAVATYNKGLNNNHYIALHKAKLENDRQYEEYLNWAAANGEGVPVPKIVTKEDQEADKKIKRLIN